MARVAMLPINCIAKTVRPSCDTKSPTPVTMPKSMFANWTHWNTLANHRTVYTATFWPKRVRVRSQFTNGCARMSVDRLRSKSMTISNHSKALISRKFVRKFCTNSICPAVCRCAIISCKTTKSIANAMDSIPVSRCSWTRCCSRYCEKFKCQVKRDGSEFVCFQIVMYPSHYHLHADMEFFVNLGDWPLMKKGGQSRTTGPYPIFSWCGSDDTFDIVMPTYDITESTLENMGRITLDMLSVQHVTKMWPDKIDKAFWRGRDARRERLQLIEIGRAHPDLFNVSLTNFFFFRDEEHRYGPKVPHISFMDFFKVCCSLPTFKMVN